MEAERRTTEHRSGRELKQELNEAQLDTLADLERYGWELKFIRRPMFQPSVAVLLGPDRTEYAVLEADGTLNENPLFQIRES